MAKQLGMINIRGTIGDITGVKTIDGYHIRRKSSLDKARVDNDPKFANSRLARNEFGTASSIGKLLRVAILGTLKKAGDAKVHSRMAQKMYAILKTDTVSPFGQRVPQLGRFEMLKGFEFNISNEFIRTLLVQYKPRIDRAAGNAVIEIPSFSPREDLLVAQGATHFKLLSSAALLDFNTRLSSVSAAESEFFPVNADGVGAFNMVQSFSPEATQPVVLVFGIRFYTMVNGRYNQLNADNFNAVRIVALG